MRKAILSLLILASCTLIGHAQCEIWDMTAQRTDCPDTELFDVEINFNHQNTSDSFTLRGNGIVYGVYAYVDLPIILHDLEGDCETPYEFVAIDQQDGDCQDFTELGTVCCPENNQECSIFDLTVEVGECDEEGQYSIIIDFEVENPTDDFYDVWVNGEFEGFYALTERPLTIDNITPRENSMYDIVRICINDNPNCCAEEEYLQPDCEAGGECSIRDMIVEPHACDDDGNYMVDIDFIYENTSDSFDLDSNGEDLGRFAYSDLPITVGPFEGNCEHGTSFLIVDVEDRSCANDIGLEPVCCEEEEECSIDDLTVEVGECNDDGEYAITIDFEVENPTDDHYDVWVNGEFRGFHNLDERPLTIDGIIPRENSDFDIVRVCINDNEDCCAEEEYEQPECSQGSRQDAPTKAPLPFSVFSWEGGIVVDNPNESDAHMNIYNTSGQVVRQIIDIQPGLYTEYLNLQPGIYFVQIGNNEYFNTFKISL